MSNFSKLQAIVNGFNFKKGDYVGAEDQLSRFAESYAQLSLEDAELLRSKFDSKDRLGWLRIASTLFVKGFADADSMEKEKLCRIFFALYSFENLEFGFDGAMDVISVSDQRKAMLAWLKGIGSNLANSLVMMPQKTIWKIRYSLPNE
ncbi:hypothetical protein [Halothiobacillus neapolitanus]|uniref:Uncharacterized protein n=1 Tax=Halothiobacillus neapolitanus (strain ATCC 23641 / DSM 15147 / CIP 104769 / NCIMB 8539 / c2) TaxID=555778 RepID=D0KXQ4_HALNC|nr:hypothetical protein [Halothiobacillus neapolitanus]ACX95227.1 hypothetical protein Hneap_0364 [Halothiobacillus neapolitanus c2]